MLFCASTLGEALVRQHKSEQAIELSKQLEEHARKLLQDGNPSIQKYAKLP